MTQRTGYLSPYIHFLRVKCPYVRFVLVMRGNLKSNGVKKLERLCYYESAKDINEAWNSFVTFVSLNNEMIHQEIDRSSDDSSCFILEGSEEHEPRCCDITL